MNEKKISFTDYCHAPAFPGILTTKKYSIGAIDIISDINTSGLSRLEYFTAAAMQGIITGLTSKQQDGFPDTNYLTGWANDCAQVTLLQLWERLR